MLRTVTVLTLILTAIFVVLMLMIPQVAPQTAVLATYQVTPDRGQAIHLLDVQRGLTYFTGLLTRPGNNSMWSADGTTLATVWVNPMPASFNTLNLTTGARESHPMQAPNGPAEWQGHPTKLAYSSALDRGSLIIYNRETGEEQTFLEEHAIRTMRWIPESDTLIVIASPQTQSVTAQLYIIDTINNEVRLLSEEVDTFFIEFIDNPLRVIYSHNHQIISFSPETPDDQHIIATLNDGEAFGFQPLANGEFQLLVSTPEREMWQVDLTNGERQLVREAGDNPYRSWSPDGEISVWMEASNALSTTLHISRAGEPPTELTINARVARSYWSPDGRYFLTFSPSDMYNTEVYLVDTATTTVQLVEQVYTQLSWQP